MLSLNKYILILLLFGTQLCAAQTSPFKLKGLVRYAENKAPVSFAYLTTNLPNSFALCDSMGNFQLNLAPADSLVFLISHLNCSDHKATVQISSDTFIIFELAHHKQQFEIVEVSQYKNKTSRNFLLNSDNIAENASQNLATQLEQLPGVSILKTGSSIGKPIVQGLYGNRLTIINNETPQGDQSWGNDHSPEIDPLGAQSIELIQGPQTLAYGGTNFAGLIRIVPGKIAPKKHLNGKVGYFFESNGRNNGLFTLLQQRYKTWAWRLNSTLKVAGDKSTPNYFQRNTGVREANFNVQIEQQKSLKWRNELYVSNFNTQIGILKGAHINTLSDLEQAFVQEEPFYTDDTFRYAIEAPMQRVAHWLAQLKSRYILSSNKVIELSYTLQHNHRKEYDIRRGKRTDKAAMDLLLVTQDIRLCMDYTPSSRHSIKYGILLNNSNNSNNPNTGILPLIPKYRILGAAGFFIATYQKAPFESSIGIHLNTKNQYTLPFSSDLPRRVLRYKEQLYSYAFAWSLKYNPNANTQFIVHLGTASRPPAINERFSAGLHQGVSSIEEGTINLNTEFAHKINAIANINIQKKLRVEVLAYTHFFKNYIYLQPQDELRLTIRGAFPVFQFQQSDAIIAGTDLKLIYTPLKKLQTSLQYSQIYGYNQELKTTLITLPSNQLIANIKLSIPNTAKFKNNAFNAGFRYVFKQNKTTEFQLIAPPPAYYLVDCALKTQVQLNQKKLTISFQINNLLNQRYRDYLNRQRYFTDDLGRSFMINCIFSF